MTRTFIFKNESTTKSSKIERKCLHCGIDISHRSKGVLFCCPACKATYKLLSEFRQMDTPEMPKAKKKTNAISDELPYKSYTETPMEKFNRKYGKH